MSEHDDKAALRPAAEQMVKLCESQFKLGDYTRAILALRWCARVDMPLPPWLANEALEAMRFAFRKGGGPGSGRGGGHAKRLLGGKVHVERHRAVACELARSGVKENAYKAAHEKLKGTPYQGQPRQMHQSYDKVEAELREALPGYGE